ncbi:MAG: DUF2231 domain-containing protein [Actinobacteria bacterium]|nr:DUF2231 domain-containing protein [Actinomycetota bacterium]
MSAPMRTADNGKRPVTAAAGPYGHPFHPILVTVPIGAWIASFVFDIASRYVDDPSVFASGSRWLIAIGVVGALAAAVFGFLDLLAIPDHTPARRTGYIHMGLNLSVAAAFAVSFLLRDGDGPVGWGLIALSAISLAALGLSGWLGGKLAYTYGVRVVDEETQASGFTTT